MSNPYDWQQDPGDVPPKRAAPRDTLLADCARAAQEALKRNWPAWKDDIDRWDASDVASAVLKIAAPRIRAEAMERAAQECDVVEEHGEVYDEPFFSNGAADCARRIRSLVDTSTPGQGREGAG